MARPRDERDRYWEWVPGRRHSLYLEHWLRCNRCSECLKHRARLWAARIHYEVENAPRTWFGTLTLNPSRLFQTELEARRAVAGYDQLPLWDKRKERLRVSGSEVTRYMKRLRKEATAKIRFVCVTETTSSGEREFHPHYHLLVHEQTRGALLHSVLAKHWTWGFEKWRLIEPQTRPEWYLCKYLLKERGDRVRASVLYGGRSETGPYSPT